jgi:hypothetical protein
MFPDGSASYSSRGAPSAAAEGVQVAAGRPEGHHAHLLRAKMAGGVPSSAGEVREQFLRSLCAAHGGVA